MGERGRGSQTSDLFERANKPLWNISLERCIGSIKACKDFREDLNHENWHKFLSSFRISFSWFFETVKNWQD